jgi:hypothetical protein
VSTLRFVTGTVRLIRLDEQTLRPMLSLAVAETEPHEVMPPVTASTAEPEALKAAAQSYAQVVTIRDNPASNQ